VCPEAVLFVDETYREATYGDAVAAESVAGIHPRVVTGASVSKALGAPGLRTGWLTVPDAELRSRIAVAWMNLVISGSVLDEALAAVLLRNKEAVLGPRRLLLAEALQQLAGWCEGERPSRSVARSAGRDGRRVMRSGASRRAGGSATRIVIGRSVVAGLCHSTRPERRSTRRDEDPIAIVAVASTDPVRPVCGVLEISWRTLECDGFDWPPGLNELRRSLDRDDAAEIRRDVEALADDADGPRLAADRLGPDLHAGRLVNRIDGPITAGDVDDAARDGRSIPNRSARLEGPQERRSTGSRR